MTVKILEGDCRELLRTLPDNSIDSCVTDPPYALVSIVKRFGAPNAAPAKGNDAYMRASAGFMGKTWDTGEVAMSTEFWAQVCRVLKPGAFVVAFGATRGYHRMACAIEDAGFEIRDSLMWIYGTGFPKSHDVSKGIDKQAGAERETLRERYTVKRINPGATVVANGEWGKQEIPYTATDSKPATPQAAEWEGWGTALKPAFEPIVLARKPLSEATVAANVLRWRTGALNIDGCRIPLGDDKPYSYPNGRGGEGWHGRESLGTNLDTPLKGNAAGRWPANAVHDGSDEVIASFPYTAPSKAAARGGSNPNPMDWGNARSDGAVVKGHTDNGGSAARFFYSAKASKADRNGSKHPTVKPVALMQWLARLVTPPGGTVLDPFAGSGTTGAACIAEGFNAILCEREAEYIADIKRRLDVPAKMPWDAL